MKQDKSSHVHGLQRFCFLPPLSQLGLAAMDAFTKFCKSGRIEASGSLSSRKLGIFIRRGQKLFASGLHPQERSACWQALNHPGFSY